MSYKELKLSPKGAKALANNWNDGVVGKSNNKKKPVSKAKTKKS